MEEGIGVRGYSMANFVVILIVAFIVGAAMAYIVKQKKKGTKCIGCPSAGTCPHKGECK